MHIKMALHLKAIRRHFLWVISNQKATLIGSASTPGPSDYYEGLPKPRSPLKKVAKQLGVDVKAKK